MERPFDYPGSQSDYFYFTVELPEYWASALINDDWGGYDRDDADSIRAYLKGEFTGVKDKDFHFYGVSDDADYTHHHDAADYTGAAMCSTFNVSTKN